MKRDLFADAARLLLALGEAENEGWSNNASGVFTGLFSPGSGRVAPTEASPAERLPVLKEAFASGSKERRLLALKACDEGLEFDRFSRLSDAEYRGLRNDLEFWEPKTDGELSDAYREIWHLLSEQLARLPKDEREEAIGILLQRASRLAKRPDLSDMVLDTLQMLSDTIYVDNRLLIKIVVEFLRGNGEDLPDDIRHRWEHLRDEWVGSDFPSMMQRYVAMNLRVDAFDETKIILRRDIHKFGRSPSKLLRTHLFCNLNCRGSSQTRHPTDTCLGINSGRETTVLCCSRCFLMPSGRQLKMQVRSS